MNPTSMRLLFTVLVFSIAQFILAQNNIRYIDAGSMLMLGKARKTDSIYQRIDSNESRVMTDAVKGLAKQSAGITILFETNSTSIRAKWQLKNDAYLANMTPIGHSGLDLYCLRGGKWQFVSAGKPARGTAQSQLIIDNMDSTLKQFMLYLPLYNGLNDLQIGVEQQAVLRTPAQPGIDASKRIVVYGSSVVQGASAGRPGMAYPAILQRKLGYDVINLGFSGSAKMEPELAAYLATVPADCYVLDCIPNPSPEQINERSYPFIKYLREHKPNTPIIIVETIFRQNGLWDLKIGANVRKQNEEIRKTYERLKAEGVKNLYYIESSKLIGDDHEATIDGIHLSDLGFMRIADAILPVIKKALR